MTKHTPGPWMKGKAGDSIVSDNPVESGPPGCDVLEYYGGHLIAESVASCNQDLIYAAPDLLIALEDLAEDIADRFDMSDPSTNPGMRNAVAAAFAAIAKARGEPK